LAFLAIPTWFEWDEWEINLVQQTGASIESKNAMLNQPKLDRLTWEVLAIIDQKLLKTDFKIRISCI
jgi:hypothetical protein